MCTALVLNKLSDTFVFVRSRANRLQRSVKRISRGYSPGTPVSAHSWQIDGVGVDKHVVRNAVG